MAAIDGDTIAENATAPKSATVDGQTFEQHSIPDQIAADRYKRSVEAANVNPVRSITRVRSIPPGTV